MGGALWCWLDTSTRHLPDDNLNKLIKRPLHRWENRKLEYKKSNDVQVISYVPLFVVLLHISSSKHVENLRKHVEGVTDKNGHCVGSIST